MEGFREELGRSRRNRHICPSTGPFLCARAHAPIRLATVQRAALGMTQPARFAAVRALALRPLAAADAALNGLIGSEANPLYQSGTVVVVAFGIMLVSGVYLLFLYRVGAPYESIEAIQAQAFAGRWLRALHRYAADAAVLAAALHVLRMWAQGRSWGPRALAWCSGLVLLFLLFLSGWTGYVMVWDTQALLLAAEGARLLDAVPIFAEPLARAFSGERPMPSAFFFLNLFAHVAVPVGMAGLLLVHVAKLARPRLAPPRRLALGITLALLALSFAVPAPLLPRAEPLALVREVPLDAFYAFWLPLTRRLSPVSAWSLLALVAVFAASAPWWTRPRKPARAAASRVDPALCTGCEQCSLDCPFDAIAMLPLAPALEADAHPAHARPIAVAHVDPARCVSCGICAGSCAPMAVGPPGRTGRDQLASARKFLGERALGPHDVVVIACGSGAASGARELGAPFETECAGNLHSSVIEFFVRSGVAGVLIASCPPRDCRGREGPKWLAERLYQEREAELQLRVDRARVRVVSAAAGESSLLAEEFARFRADLAALERARGDAEVVLGEECAASAAGASS